MLDVRKKDLFYIIIFIFYSGLTSLANANTPKILVIINASDSSKYYEQYSAQGFFSALCEEDTCLEQSLSLPFTPPQTIPFSLQGHQINIELIDISKFSMSNIDINTLCMVILSEDIYELINPTIELPIFTISVAPLPENYLNSKNILSVIPDYNKTSKALFRLLSFDDIQSYMIMYHPDSKNSFLASSMITETDNFQRIGTGVNLDGNSNKDKNPVQLLASFPIYDNISNLFESQKGLTASFIGDGLKKGQANLNAFLFLGSLTALNDLYLNYSNYSTNCYGIGNLMNSKLFEISADISIQLIVPAFAKNRTQLEIAHQSTFEAPPPFHFLADYGYDAGLFLKSLIEQQVISQTTLDRDQLVERAQSFVFDGITGQISFLKNSYDFNTIIRECVDENDCQWKITQKDIKINKEQSLDNSVPKNNSLSKKILSIKKQKSPFPKVVFLFPESNANTDEITMAQQVLNGFFLATESLPISIVIKNSQVDTNYVKSLFYGKPSYILTQEKIYLIEQDEVPSSIISQISPLLNQTFETEDALRDQLISLIGTDATKVHGNIIIYHAYESNGFYDQSEILSIVIVQSGHTESITVHPEKRNILILGPASDAIIKERPNIINFFPGDQKTIEALEKRLLKIAKINNQTHRYITIVQSDPFQSPASLGIFHSLFSNSNLFESIIQQFNGCDPRIQGVCQPAIYPKWTGTFQLYENFDKIFLANFLDAVKEKFDHLVFIGNTDTFIKVKTAVSSKPDVQKKIWSANSSLDRPSVPQIQSIESMRMQVATVYKKHPTYFYSFLHKFGYEPGRFEDIGYNIGHFIKSVLQDIEENEKILNRANMLLFSQKRKDLQKTSPDIQMLMPKNGEWVSPSEHDFDQDGKADLSDAIFLLKKCAAF